MLEEATCSRIELRGCPPRRGFVRLFAVPGPYVAVRRPGRNDPCHCGSGKKYKRCCLRLDEANDPFRRVLDADPREPDGCHALGLMALYSGRTDSAIALFTRAIEGNAAEPAYHCNLGLAYKAAGRKDEAEASYRRSLSLKPDFAPANGNLGVLYCEQGRYDDAVCQFRNALAAEPISAEQHNNLGNALLMRDEVGAALESFRRAAELKPGFALAYNNAGNALQRLGKLAEAIDFLERALALQPDDPRVNFNLANTLCDFGKVDDAAGRYRAALALDPAFAEAHNGLGLMLMELGRKEEAVDSLRAALALSPDLAEAHFNLHSVLLDSRDLTPSMECLRKVLALRPDDQRARSHLHVLLDYAGDADAAAPQLRRTGAPSAEAQAILDGWQHVKGASTALPSLAGISGDAFRIGLQGARPDGLVLEFGVRFGVSIRQIASLANQQVHGFDSFEGLPEAWGSEPRGSYSTFGTLPVVPANVTLHPGWFDQTLPEFIRKHAGPVRFMNVDCDIYSSTRTVLTLLAGRIVPGTVIAFDEFFGHEGWENDEFRAFHEMVSECGWRYEYLCFGLSTGQAVVRIG